MTTTAVLREFPSSQPQSKAGMLGSTCRLGSTPWVSAQRKIIVASTRSSSVSVTSVEASVVYVVAGCSRWTR